MGCLFYIIEPGSTIAEISPEEIYEFLNEQIARYKIPQKTFALDKLPRNAVGKVLKHELFQMVEI